MFTTCNGIQSVLDSPVTLQPHVTNFTVFLMHWNFELISAATARTYAHGISHTQSTHTRIHIVRHEHTHHFFFVIYIVFFPSFSAFPIFFYLMSVHVGDPTVHHVSYIAKMLFVSISFFCHTICTHGRLYFVNCSEYIQSYITCKSVIKRCTFICRFAWLDIELAEGKKREKKMVNTPGKKWH